MKAAIVYWSKTGNTEQVARTIEQTLEQIGAEVDVRRAEAADDLDWFSYDLVCLGFPSYRWRPPKPVDDLLNAKFNQYRRQDRVRVGAPNSGHQALIFCTYSGPHTGIEEATPATSYENREMPLIDCTTVLMHNCERCISQHRYRSAKRILESYASLSTGTRSNPIVRKSLSKANRCSISCSRASTALV